MPNGVSFSLVDGACCFVNFTSTSKASVPVQVTLNINSTGAKYLRSKCWSTDTRNYGPIYSTSTATTGNYLYIVPIDSACTLFIYADSVYSPMSTYNSVVNIYNDYSDN